MNPWVILIIALAAIGALFIIAGQKFSFPLLYYLGFSVMGMVSIVIGLEAMIKRRMILPSRYSRRQSETYTGAAAFAYGILFILWGVFFIGVSGIAYLNTGRATFLYFVQHPGPILLLFGLTCFTTAIIALGGYEEQKRGEKWAVALDFLTSRLLPGLILIVIALAATGLGTLEIAAPQTFDQLGGGFLEVLFSGP